MAASAVEPQRAALVPGATQLLIRPAQEKRKALAPRAGFMKFLPMPP